MKACLVTKLVGAVGIAACAVGIAYGVGSVVMAPHALTKNAFVIDTAILSQASGAPTSSASAAPAPEAPTLPPIKDLLAKADPAAGQKYAKVCATCHSFGKGEAAKMGPNLYGILGAPHAHMAGYAYSAAMQAHASDIWTYEELNHFLFKPSVHIPGTKMPFAGIKNDSDRANVISWLRTLSETPEALP